MHRVEGRPQVVAHRGSSHDNPEHTLGAYVAALDTGAEGLECDVRLTADGHLVCVHDRRIDRVTDGRGLVSTMELADLDALDFASWKNPWAELDDEAPELDEDTKRVLTLRRLLEMARDYDRPVDLAIETKHPTRYAGLVERRLVELLNDVGWAAGGSPVRVMSFSPVALTRVKKLAPELEVVLLMERQYSWQMAANVLGPGWIAGPGHRAAARNPQARTKAAQTRTADARLGRQRAGGPRPVRLPGRRSGHHRRPARARWTTSTGRRRSSPGTETNTTQVLV